MTNVEKSESGKSIVSVCDIVDLCDIDPFEVTRLSVRVCV